MPARTCLALVGLSILAGCSAAQRRGVPVAPAVPVASVVPVASSKPAAIGETLAIESRVLGERRTINVYVPPGYAASTARYPVLYALDGGLAEDFPHVVGAVDVSVKNAVIAPMIVVGIENTVRRRDLVGPTAIPEEQQVAPQAGGAARFRAFLRDELKPLIARRYRTTAASAIIGESFAGLFVLETFVHEPTLFDGYIAVDPSVWWAEQAVVGAASARVAWMPGAKTLYVATADSAETQAGVEVLVTALRVHAPAGVTWHHESMPDEQHGTIYPRAALRGIRWMFAAPPAEGR